MSNGFRKLRNQPLFQNKMEKKACTTTELVSPTDGTFTASCDLKGVEGVLWIVLEWVDSLQLELAVKTIFTAGWEHELNQRTYNGNIDDFHATSSPAQVLAPNRW